MVPWDPEEAYGTPRGGRCSIPGCTKPIDARGLCKTCFKVWRRGGLAGLERRIERLKDGADIRVPLNVEKALILLTDEYEKWMAVDAEDDALYEKHKRRVVKICAAIGDHERRKRQNRFRDQYRKEYIEKHGIEAWRAKVNQIQRRYRASKRQATQGDTAVDQAGKLD